MKALLVKIDAKAFAKLEAMAKLQRRKPGPMAALILEKYLNEK